MIFILATSGVIGLLLVFSTRFEKHEKRREKKDQRLHYNPVACTNKDATSSSTTTTLHLAGFAIDN